MEDLIQGINIPTTRGTAHKHVMVTDIGEITADHSPTPICTTTEAATLEGTPHALLPATITACTTLQLRDALAVITTDIVAPHHAFAISPTGVTHTTPQTEATLTPVAPTMQHKILSPGR